MPKLSLLLRVPSKTKKKTKTKTKISQLSFHSLLVKQRMIIYIQNVITFPTKNTSLLVGVRTSVQRRPLKRNDGTYRRLPHSV